MSIEDNGQFDDGVNDNNTNQNTQDQDVNNNTQTDDNDPASQPGSMDQIVDDILKQEGRNNQGQQQQQQRQGQQQQRRAPGQQGQQRGSGQQQQGQQGQQGQLIPLAHIPGAFVNQQGNVVDWAGRPLARSGAERRLFEQASGPVKGVMERLKQAEDQIEVFNRAHNISKDNGLTAAEILMGHQIAAAWKKDPAKTMQFLLQQARQQGISVDGIGDTNAIDIPAIANAIEERIAKALQRFDPIVNDFTRQAELREQDNRVNSAVDQFLQEYPDAAVQEAAISDIMEASGFKLSMHQAYTLALRYCHEKGLDWNKPLVEQVNGSASNTANARNQSPANGRELPPMGRGGNSATNRVRPVKPRTNDSFDAIFDEVMRENGLRGET